MRISFGGAKYTPPTRSFFIHPKHYGTASQDREGNFPIEIIDITATEYAMWAFGVPKDFSSLTAVKLLFIPTTTGTVDWTVATDFGADGELSTANSDSDTADALSVTDNTLILIDITAAFTGLAAGDFVGVKFLIDVFTDTTAMLAVGLEFSYTE